MAFDEKQYKKEWRKANKKTISADITIQEHEKLKEHCKKNNISIAELIKNSIKDILNREYV